MAACDGCKGLKRNTLGVSPHDRMKESRARYGCQLPGASKSSISYFRCEVCQTAWQYKPHKDDSPPGFSLE